MRLLTSEIAQLKSSLHISQLTVSQLKQELSQKKSNFDSLIEHDRGTLKGYKIYTKLLICFDSES